jgi:glycosyltransferase involved in cell wall biosynthesis
MPLHQNKFKVTFSVTNCICYDQRVLKIAEAVSSLGCDITIIGRIRGDCCKTDLVPFTTKRFNMFFKRGFLFYAFFNIRLFFYLLFHRSDLLVANDLDTLLPNYIISRIKSIPIVYDSHEYFTELPEIQNRHFVKWFWSSIEKYIFPRLKYVMTVSEPIASAYEQKYKVKVSLVRNLSTNADHVNKYTKQELNISEGDLLLIIQGTGINIDKGAEELIDAVNCSTGVTLLIVGSGDVVSKLKIQVDNYKIPDKVRFYPSVSWENLIKFTKSADIGMSLEKDTNLNYRYSLPNKFFDYIAAGIPVIASDLPETGKIIKENNFGLILSSVTPIVIKEALEEIKSNPGRLLELKTNAASASKKLNWENEKKKVIEFYNKILICG